MDREGFPGNVIEDARKWVDRITIGVRRAGERPEDEPLRERYRVVLERTIFWTMVVGAVLTAVGALGINVPLGRLDEAMFWLFGAGLILTGVSILASHPLETYRILYRDITGGSRYDQLRFWTRLKTAGILLHLLTIIGVVTLAVSVLSRVGVLEIGQLPFNPVFRAMAAVSAVLVATLAYTHHMSLRTPLEKRSKAGLEALFFYLAVAGAFAFGALGLALGTAELDLVLLEATATDAPFFLLASATLASAALFIGRSPPTLSILFVDEREYYRGHTHLSRQKSILLPAMMAFALLFLVVIAVMTFGLGVVNLFEEIPQNSVLLGVFVFIVGAMVVSIALTVSIARREEASTLYRERMTVETRQELAVLAVSAAATTILFAMSFLTATGSPMFGMGPHHWVDLAAVGIMAAVGPYGFYISRRHRRIRQLEERFPDFLRDIAASHKAGLTMESAVKIASKGDYGQLTPDIVKMADQLSWNVPFNEALRRFADRVETPLVRRSVSLVEEADRTGGNVTDVLMAAARDAREIKTLERERRSTMTLYTAVIYITFFVFLAVAAIMFGSFVPEIISAIESVKEVGGSPVSAGLNLNLISLVDYRTFYFLAALVQATGNGIVAGLVEDGKYLSGLKHSFVMVLSTVVIFSLLL